MDADILEQAVAPEAEEKAEDGEKEDDADAEEQLPAEVLPDAQAGIERARSGRAIPVPSLASTLAQLRGRMYKKT